MPPSEENLDYCIQRRDCEYDFESQWKLQKEGKNIILLCQGFIC